MTQFDSILAPDLRIDQSLIDYKKLKIQGNFPRKQRLPGDVFPTLATLQAIGDDGNASALMATKAGSLHVTVDPSGSGSNVPNAQKWQTQEADNVILVAGWQDLFGVPANPVLLVYGFDWNIRAPSTLPAGRGHGRLELEFYVPTTNFNRHHIVSRDFWYSAAAGEAYNLSLWDTVALSTPLDYGQSISPVENDLYVSARSVGVEGWVIGFKLWYYDGSY